MIVDSLKNKVKNRFMQRTSATAALWMVMSAFCSAVMVILVRFVENEVSVPQMIFMRNGFGILVFLPFMLMRGFGHFKTKRIKNHFFRASTGVFAMLIFFHCIRQMELPVVVAITYTVPLFSSIIAYFYFNDRPGPHRITAIAFGFIGALIVIRPGFEGFTPLSLLMVLCSLFWALSGVQVKELGRTEKASVITFYLTTFMTLFTLPIVAITGWATPSMLNTFWIALIAIVSVTLQYCLSQALSMADISFLYPFDYSRLIFTALFAYIIFHQVIDLPTIIGSLVIIISAIYTAYREHKKGMIKPETTSNIA